MIIHLVAIILSNLAGFAWLADIKYVFEKTNGLNSWINASLSTFCMFVWDIFVFANHLLICVETNA